MAELAHVNMLWLGPLCHACMKRCNRLHSWCLEVWTTCVKHVHSMLTFWPTIYHLLCSQAEQRSNTSAVQSALTHALQHVPLINGATTGGPDQVLLTVHCTALVHIAHY